MITLLVHRGHPRDHPDWRMAGCGLNSNQMTGLGRYKADGYWPCPFHCVDALSGSPFVSVDVIH